MVKVAVIGCGLMGTKIAGEMAYHGHRVKLYDANTNALNSAYERIEADKTLLMRDGILPQRNFIGQILCLSSLSETVGDAEFIFEAIVDDLNQKQILFEEISRYCQPTVVLATNTLHLDVTAIAERFHYKERCLGLRFLFPVYSIPEVEITTSKYTSPDVIEKIHLFMERMGKTLFFRSGGEPLILTEEQREERKLAHLEELNSSSKSSLVNGGWRRSFSLSHGSLNLQHSTPAADHVDMCKLNSVDSVETTATADKDCAICMDKLRDCLLAPCHHLVTCHDCAQSLLDRHDSCPICRKDITQVIHVYHS